MSQLPHSPPGLNVLMDVSHFNGAVDFSAASSAGGIVGVIHKATEGLQFVDPNYAANKAKAMSAGLLWGAYHFGTGDDATAQAEHFLTVAQPAAADLLALDVESNSPRVSMSLDQARTFVSRVQEATGRWPGLYGGAYLKSLLGSSTDPVLGNCWLWLSQYDSNPLVPPAWERWTLWQYTDGTHGSWLPNVPGLKACDRDTFNGSLAELQTFWRGL